MQATFYHPMIFVRRKYRAGLLFDFARLSLSLILFNFALNESKGALAMAANWPGEWSAIGRTTIQATPGSVVVQGGFVADNQAWDDAELSLRARAPLGTDQVQ